MMLVINKVRRRCTLRGSAPTTPFGASLEQVWSKFDPCYEKIKVVLSRPPSNQLIFNFYKKLKTFYKKNEEAFIIHTERKTQNVEI